MALCRDRNKYLDQALRQTQALADAHVAYLECLRTLGPTLRRFFDIGVEEPCNSLTTSASNSKSGSGSDSHIQLSSDSEPEDGADKQSDESLITQIRNYGDLNSRGVVFTSNFSKTPPPPPSPISSTWDFLNLFDDVYERYESSYALNAERAIDDKIQNKIDNDVSKNVKNAEEEAESRPTEKKEKSDSAKQSSPIVEVKKGVAEAMTELQLQFRRASESGNEVLKLLSHSHHHRINSVHPGIIF